MRTKSLEADDKKEEVSFAFKQQQIEPSQVEAHWKKIKEKIDLINAKKAKKLEK